MKPNEQRVRNLIDDVECRVNLGSDGLQALGDIRANVVNSAVVNLAVVNRMFGQSNG